MLGAFVFHYDRLMLLSGTPSTGLDADGMLIVSLAGSSPETRVVIPSLHPLDADIALVGGEQVGIIQLYHCWPRQACALQEDPQALNHV